MTISKTVKNFYEKLYDLWHSRDFDNASKLVIANRELSYETAEILSETAYNHYLNKDYVMAIGSSYLALFIYTNFNDSVKEGEVCHFLGTMYSDNHDYEQAITFFNNAIHVAKQIKDKELLTSSLNKIALCQSDLGDYQSTLNSYHDLLSIYREYHNNVDLASEAQTLTNIAVIHKRMGEYGEAYSYIQEALQLIEDIEDNFPSYKDIYGFILNHYGEFDITTGNYDNALKKLFQALPLFKEAGDLNREASALTNIGSVYRYVGDYKTAINYFDQAHEVYGNCGNTVGVAIVMNNLGELYTQTNEYHLAQDYFNNALHLIQDDINIRLESKIYGSLGTLYSFFKKYDLAEEYYHKSLDIKQTLFDLEGQAITLNQIGTMHYKIDNYELALQFFNDSLEIAQTNHIRKREAEVLGSLGLLFEKQGEFQKSLEYYKESVDIYDEIRNLSGGIEAKEGFLEQNIDIYLRTMRVLIQLENFEEAFIYAEKSKARSTLDLMQSASKGIKENINSDIILKQYDIHSRIKIIRDDLKGFLDQEYRKSLEAELIQLEHSLADLNHDLRNNNPKYAELEDPTILSIKDIQQNVINENEVIVEYVHGENELIVFIVGRNKFRFLIIETKMDYLIESVALIVKNISSNNQEHVLQITNHQIFETIFAPIVDHIHEVNDHKSIENLIIVPDTFLFYIPFEMLIVELDSNPKYLVEDYPISYSPSASLLNPKILNFNQSNEFSTEIFAVAPFTQKNMTKSFGSDSEYEYGYKDLHSIRKHAENVDILPHSEAEVEYISNLYENSILITGNNAIKKIFFDHSLGSKYIHIATHGYLDSEEPMYSGLLFSDDILQSYEIFDMNIDAEMVVLSACVTGLGKLRNGEGLIGITRAFFYAGTPSLIVSLWNVADVSTSAFMMKFYEFLKGGLSKSEALRQTKIWMIKESFHNDQYDNKVLHDNPFYWAPFILIGSYR